MDEAVVVVDLRHIVAAVELELAGADGGPLVVATLDKAFTDHDAGTADDDAAGVARVDSDGAAGLARGVGDGHDGGGGEGAPGLLVVGDVESIHEAVSLDDHSVEVGGVGLRDSELHAGVGAAEGGVARRDVDGVELVGCCHNVADTIELVAAAEESRVVDAGDDELVNPAVEDGRGGLVPVVGTFGVTPAVETAVGGGIEIEDAVDIDIVEGVDRLEVVVVGVGHEFERNSGGIVAINTHAFD